MTEDRQETLSTRRELRRLIAAHALENRALKAKLTTTWTEPMDETQRAYVRSRRRTTELHVALAHLRGRRHLERPLREGAYPGMTWDAERYHQRVTQQVLTSLAPAARGAA